MELMYIYYLSEKLFRFYRFNSRFVKNLNFTNFGLQFDLWLLFLSQFITQVKFEKQFDSRPTNLMNDDTALSRNQQINNLTRFWHRNLTRGRYLYVFYNAAQTNNK